MNEIELGNTAEERTKE